ncbi:1-deoxy-D-xylulose-5-phosphate synthase [Streptomyces sp. NRRL F-2664]|uniref:1-deoxy-D-xylulose-5-phosphate synthase n=1 Tax=Streptomyces sp. NRRL F-2664 TaxID=1463842 RepID=UPI0004C7F040|nr:1-deoxy-D-xylulose-5-phosphate synthase [Streptomyces sp. NRRL F-2664]
MNYKLQEHEDLLQHADPLGQEYPLLASLTSLDALRALPAEQLPVLAAEMRGLLVQSVTATGGHLGVGLGVVELTMALHRVFSSPRDAIIFDTGHQSYPHKILTGRAGGFTRLRQAGGLSGYPSRAESQHDWVENSHASTGLAYADGLAKAFKLTGQTDRRTVAVVGDGALTGGMAFEALNNIGASGRPVIIVLNDNGRSYDPTAGSLAHHLTQLRQGGVPLSQNLFTRLGLAYTGPLDGHDTTALEEAFHQAAALHRPVIVHTITQKGRGYAPAEADPADRMHACGVVDPATGKAARPSKPSWTALFGQEITALAEERSDIVALTAAMRLPVGLGAFSARFPERTFDSGIAEQHAVTCAAGLAMGGLHPVVCLYATFLNRAFDQLLMDVGLHRLPVTFVLDRAGITGPDGPSHHGMWDLALLSRIPGLRLAAPRDPARLSTLLREAVDICDGPTALRYPKATAGPDIDAIASLDGIDILHRTPHRPLDVLLVAIGVTATACLDAARHLAVLGLGSTVVDPRWAAPVNPALGSLAARHRLTLTVEDGIADGGIGTLVAHHCSASGISGPVHTIGLPTTYLAHGERDDLLASAGITGPSIADSACRHLSPPAPDHHGLLPSRLSRSTP